MPDLTATRPSSGGSIESGWGQQVHDMLEGVQAGQATVTLNNVATNSVNVTFPRAYTAPPIVVAVPFLASASYVCSVASVTATGFALWIGTRSGNPITSSPAGNWMAVGTPA